MAVFCIEQSIKTDQQFYCVFARIPSNTLHPGKLLIFDWGNNRSGDDLLWLHGIYTKTCHRCHCWNPRIEINFIWGLTLESYYTYGISAILLTLASTTIVAITIVLSVPIVVLIAIFTATATTIEAWIVAESAVCSENFGAVITEHFTTMIQRRAIDDFFQVIMSTKVLVQGI